MLAHKRFLLYVNVIGGLAVLGSYAWGFRTHPNAAVLLWGGVPNWIRPFYSVSMLCAALGYFAFTVYILFWIDPVPSRIFRRFRFSTFNIIYSAILFPSACWMPLTFLAIQTENPLTYWLVRMILIVVGIASLSLLAALLSLRPRQSSWVNHLAVLGSIFFCIQTAFLDAAIWGSYFRLP